MSDGWWLVAANRLNEWSLKSVWSEIFTTISRQFASYLDSLSKVDKPTHRIRQAIECPGCRPFQTCEYDFPRREWSKLVRECYLPDEPRSFPRMFAMAFCALIFMVCNRWPMRKCQAIWLALLDFSNSNPCSYHSSTWILIYIQSDTFRKRVGKPLKILRKSLVC